MSFLKLNQKLRRVEVSGFEIDNPIAFSFFDRLAAEDRDATFLRALYLGVLALKEDRLSAFLAKTANELGTELESLKIIFDLKQELFFKSAVKGALAEEDIANYLNEYFEAKKLRDRAQLTGNAAGKIKRNKTGDIVCNVDGRDDLRIVLECKFDKSIRLGDPEKRDLFSRRADTVWSQLLEASANREGRVAIIVLDYSLIDAALLSEVEGVAFVPAIGFIAVVDSQKNDYSNLAIAYGLARNVAMNAKEPVTDQAFLEVLLKRIIFDLRSTREIETLVKANVENNRAILAQIEKSMLSMEFSLECMQRFLRTGKVSREEMLEFYMGDAPKERFKAIELDIKNI
ncbi:MAG: hypothetical protein EOP06_03630 [Proteobacteria bacterium]|nr:MAG: hypothetical protein EOP06_03630 [Pseudomonadota bacterium]